MFDQVMDIFAQYAHNDVVYWRPEPELYKPYLQSLIKRGLGIGQGAAYKPTFNVRDVPSDGSAHVIQGMKVPCQFHILSDLEATHFYERERDPKVVGIRDNFPIYDIDWTMEACARFGTDIRGHRLRKVLEGCLSDRSLHCPRRRSLRVAGNREWQEKAEV